MASNQGPGGGVGSALIRKLSNLLNASANLRVITRSKAVSPTRLFFYVTLTLNPSPRGRDLPSPSRALVILLMLMTMQKNIIAAVADNMAIGRDNELLWHISADMRYFRRVTMGCPIIMGYKTRPPMPRCRRNVSSSVARKLTSARLILPTSSTSRMSVPPFPMPTPSSRPLTPQSGTKNPKRPWKPTRKTAFSTPSRCTSERRDFRGIPLERLEILRGYRSFACTLWIFMANG